MLSSVRGSGHIFQNDPDRRTFSFAARQNADGTASGHFSLLLTEPVFGSENPSVTQLQAEVTCMTVQGNVAWIGGVVRGASNPEWVGRETGWAVQDYREGPDSYDRFSLMDVPAEGLADRMCNERYRWPNVLVDQGNIQISTGGPMNDRRFPFVTWQPVCGEWASFAGSVHPVFHYDFDSGDRFHIQGHYNSTGIGVGLTSSDVYNWNEVTNFNQYFSGLKATLTDQSTFNVIGRGAADDLRLHVNTHFTTTPDGVEAVWMDNFRFECSTNGPA